MRRIPKNVLLTAAIAATAVAGVAVGAITGRPAPAPEATPAVAALPTSTPDLRPPPPTRTLTPTQRPTATPTLTPVTVEVTNPPNLFPPVTAAPRATPTPEPRGRPVVFFAAPGKAPAPVSILGTSSGPDSDRVFYRLALLRQQTTGGPEGYVNLYAKMKARLVEVTVAEPRIVTIGFSAANGDWGVTADQVKLLVQQIVFTATEEPTIDWVVLTQNGKPAAIAGQTFDKPIGRDEVR